MKLTTLDIKYDPDLPFGMQGPDPMDHVYSAPEPRFPYRGSGVRVLGIEFTRKRINTGGPDPYAGDRWRVAFGPRYHEWFEFEVHNVVCCEATVELSLGLLINHLYIATGFPWGWPAADRLRNTWLFKFHKLRACQHRWSDMPWAVALLWDFLEYRWEWFQCNEPDEYRDYYE